MAGEGEGGPGGDPGPGPGGGGGGDGGSDVAAIWRYINHHDYGSDGDYSGNGGYSGASTGPPGSQPPPVEPASSASGVSLLDLLDQFWSAPESADPITRQIDDWSSPARPLVPAHGPARTLRQPNLLRDPGLLAENDAVAGCNPNRTSCLPHVVSDARESSWATLLQTEMDSSFVATEQLAQGRARVIADPEVDVQILANAAAQLANSDRYRLEYTANLLRSHPIEVRHDAVLTGLGHVASGGALAVGSGLIIYGSGGLAWPLVGAMGLGSGLATASSGLALAISGADSTETVRMSGQLDYVAALTSGPAALVFGTTGLVISDGDQHVSHGFATVGGLAEAAMSIRGDPSKLYSGLLPGIETTLEQPGATLLIKEVEALGFTARRESAAVAATKLTREFSASDRRAIEAFRLTLAQTGRLDLAGQAGHTAAGAAARGVDFSKYGGAFQQELKLHGPYTPIYDLQLDRAWTQGLQYSIKYQLETRAIGGEQLVPLRSAKHIWVSPTDAVRLLY